jgi:L-threonine kinase
MYNAVTAFNHRQVRLRATLGALPPMTVVGLDEGGVVDTMGFNMLPKPFDHTDRRTYGRLLRELTDAVADHDLATVGRIATRSAECNQRLNPKRSLEALRTVCTDIGALGVVVAHSGTVIGLLLGDDDPHYATRRAKAERACLALAGNVSVYHSLRFDPARESTP